MNQAARKKARLLLLVPVVAGAFYLRSLVSWRPKILFAAPGRVQQLVFSGNGKTLLIAHAIYGSGLPGNPIGGSKRTVTAVDTQSAFAPLWQSKEEDSSLTGQLQFASNDFHVVMDGRNIQTLDAHSGKTLTVHNLPGRIVISPDGKWRAYRNYENDGRVYLNPAFKRLPDGYKIMAAKILDNPQQTAEEFAFSPDSKTLVIGVGTPLGAHLDFYDTTTWKRTRTWQDSKRHIPVNTPPTYNTVQWSRNGQFLLSCWSYYSPTNPGVSVDLWRVSDGKRLAWTSLNGTPSLALQNDGRFLYYYPDGFNWVFLSNSPQNNFTFERLLNLSGETVTAAAISPDGSYLVAGTQSGRVFRQRVK